MKRLISNLYFDGEQSSTEEDNNQNSSKSNIKKSISDKIQIQ